MEATTRVAARLAKSPRNPSTSAPRDSLQATDALFSYEAHRMAVVASIVRLEALAHAGGVRAAKRTAITLGCCRACGLKDSSGVVPWQVRNEVAVLERTDVCSAPGCRTNGRPAGLVLTGTWRTPLRGPSLDAWRLVEKRHLHPLRFELATSNLGTKRMPVSGR